MSIDGNETKYNYNGADQLVRAGDTEYEYDDNGNQIIQNSPDGHADYSYNAANQLTKALFTDGSYVKYSYDGLGRKISREEKTYHPWGGNVQSENISDNGNDSNGHDNDNNENSPKGNANGHSKKECGSKGTGQENALNNGNGNKYGLMKQEETPEAVTAAEEALTMPELKDDTERTAYLYMGLSNLVHKEYSDKGSPYGEYYTGPGNEIVSRKMFGLHGLVNPAKEPDLDTKGGLMYYLYNGRHTVSELTDRHGDLIEQYRYDAFGGIFNGITGPYNTTGYSSQQYDEKSGLMDMKARWYDPTSARFMTEDSYPGTLSAPFTQNRYAYVAIIRSICGTQQVMFRNG